MERIGELRKIVIKIIISTVVCIGLLCLQSIAGAGISGKLVRGFRILDVKELADRSHLLVFRGDYIKFDLGGEPRAKLSIPGLGIEAPLTPDLDRAPYFKMKQKGAFAIFINKIGGTLTVVEYSGAHYRAVSAHEAQDVIHTFSPLILDVRTPKEYAGGRLKGAVLIPVQTLQKRLPELFARKDDPILIYCATGNRSTVASKILIDKGFSRIFNLRHGIADWYRQRYPIEK